MLSLDDPLWKELEGGYGIPKANWLIWPVARSLVPGPFSFLEKVANLLVTSWLPSSLAILSF